MNFLNNLKEKVPAITGNPALDGAILKGIIALVVMILAWARQHLGLTDPDFTLALGLSLVSCFAGVVTFVYGWILSQITRAKQIQTGIVLTTSGHAVDVNGAPITVTALAPPKQVTLESAPQIVATVGPIEHPKAA